ncbi:hypothetical protein BH11PSE11_BH11PSE11_24910 [soil metagenome]
MGITACIVGATGLVGTELLALLCQDSHISHVHVMTRRALAPKLLEENPKLTAHVLDFDRMQELQWPQCDLLFSCLGTTIRIAGSQEAFRRVDFDYVVDSARQAHHAGATSLLVVSAMGADQHSRVFYNRVKGEMEAAVASLGFDTVLIFRPSLISGERLQRRFVERVFQALLTIFNPLLPRKYRSVPARAIANCMLTTAKEAHRGTVIFESDKLLGFA